ncbi:MAG: nitrate transporter integral rane protein, partial [Pseudomonadota bacterium]
MSSASSAARPLPLTEGTLSSGEGTAAASIPAPSRRTPRTPERFCRVLTLAGLGFLVPMVRMACGEDPRIQLAELWRTLGVPLVSILVFLLAWSWVAGRIETSLGQIPGPSAVWTQAGVLWADHKAERAKAVEFYARQERRDAERLAEDPTASVTVRRYTGKPTYIDQIFTSLKTVFTGFLFATLIAVPIGILCGMSRLLDAAFNPFVQVFKPISPLAWLPIVTLIVSALYVSEEPMFEKAFLISAITVALCSLWPTVINTSLGVASIDK